MCIDSTFYYTCVQDFRLHIYDTKAPILPRPHIDGDHVSTMKHTKSIRAVPGGWTITDSHLSPDNSLLAYAVMSPTVFLANTGEGEIEQRSVYFGNDRGSSDWRDHYGIWSCRFSADGKELVAGGSGKLMGESLCHLRSSRCSPPSS
jgi:DDB1- and CUL4-associated factor 11